MLGTSLDGLSPVRRYLEKSRRYRTERRHIAARQAQEAAAEEVPSEPPAIKGQCRYCGKPMNRGLHFHERKCRQSKT